jgi:hypothetical protein
MIEIGGRARSEAGPEMLRVRIRVPARLHALVE